jgi:hypothetical protein
LAGSCRLNSDNAAPTRDRPLCHPTAIGDL